MADERIIELDTANEVLDDDYLAIDSVSGETRKIKPIKIGATYEIEDGDHEFTLVGSNGYEHTVEIPSDSVSMTQAEYNALTPAQKADGTARFITDAESDVESELWSKVGRQTLDTDSQVLSNAVNELKGSLTNLGTFENGDFNSISVTSGTWTKCKEFTLNDAGVYILNSIVSFADSNASIYTHRIRVGSNNYNIRNSASNGGGSNLSLIISISTPTTIQLYVNTSFATTTNGYFQYVRLT